MEDIDMIEDGDEALYVKRQFSKCINRLSDQIRMYPFKDGFVTRNNLFTAKIQKAHALDDYELLITLVRELKELWSELSSLPFNRNLSSLTLALTSNVIYSYVMLENSSIEENSTVNVAVKALEILALQLGEVPLTENRSDVSIFQQLGENLVHSAKLTQTELSLLLYITLIINLVYKNEVLVALMKEIMNVLKPEENDASNNEAVFLLSPADLPLVVGQKNFQQTIYQLSRAFIAVHYCATSQWTEAQDLSKMHTDILFPLMEFVNLYSMLCGNESPNICWSDDANESNEYIHLAKCLLHAAMLVKTKKHSMAVEFLRIAIGGALGATKICCIPVVCTALQFQHLGEPDLEVEAWTVAEDILLNSPELSCRFHSETIAFFLQQMGLLRIPSVITVQYRLARSLLENKLYDKAVAVYDQLADASNGEMVVDDVIPWMGLPPLPSTQIITHERILSLLSAKLFDRALDVIQSSPEDFVLLYLHAQVAVYKKQKPKAIKMINRAIQLLDRNSFRPPEMAHIIESKFHWKLAVLFNSSGNYQDALHQLRFATQQNPSDTHLIEYYKEFIAKSGVKITMPESHSLTRKNLEETVKKYFQLNDDWAIHHILKSLND